MSDVIERSGYPEDVMKAAREAAAVTYSEDWEDRTAVKIRAGNCDKWPDVRSAARAILAERERCKRVAERLEDGDTHSAKRPGWTGSVHEHAVGVAETPSLYREGMGEPRAWVHRYIGNALEGPWKVRFEPPADEELQHDFYEFHPLYLSPPDASALAEEVKRLRSALERIAASTHVDAFNVEKPSHEANIARTALAKEPADV